ncbi:MAG: hypothetical protein JNM29_12335 [Candidatus Odyssella sp.]|nr:hypothetical protein [Candidatus Odyssella sp.]
MFLGDILVAHKLVTPADVAEAIAWQKREGGRLGDILVAQGKLRAEDLEAIMHGAPSAPRTLAETGLALPTLLNLMIKAMYSGACETPSQIAKFLALPPRPVQLLIEQAQQRKLLDVLGAPDGMSEVRYVLGEKGKHWALDALEQNQYIGPAPVSLASYIDRIQRQRIVNERIDKAAIQQAFSNLVVSDEFIQMIGPAINSGRSILLYGAPGNGKTTIAERIGGIFEDVIYIPYCFEVEGQIIKVFDPGIHHRVERSTQEGHSRALGLRRDDLDMRWVPCRRPFIVTGGELTLEMLDLSFNALAKFYEAPLHVKALGGTFVIDDFGRQLVKPEALLNRWIVPLESRVEYLKLHTGKSFRIPFDELVIFSTNLSPRDLMDPAFLRRIPYKLEIGTPNAEEYRLIFRSVSRALGLEAADEVMDYVMMKLRELGNVPFAGYQPKFIVDQVIAACKFEGIQPQYRPEFVDMAIANLHPKDPRSSTPPPAVPQPPMTLVRKAG